MKACAILDLGRAPVARDVDRHRSADAHLAAACAFVHRRGLGCDVCVVFCCKRHRTRARINGGATAHHGLAAGVNQVQRQRTSNTDLAAARARRGFGLYGVGGVTGHIGHPGVQREPVGVDHSAAADDRVSHRGHFIDRHCSADAHLCRAALGLAIGIGLWQCTAVGRDLGIGVVRCGECEGAGRCHVDWYVGARSRVLQVHANGRSHRNLAFAGAGRTLAILLRLHGTTGGGLLFAVTDLVGRLLVFAQSELFADLVIDTCVLTTARTTRGTRIIRLVAAACAGRGRHLTCGRTMGFESDSTLARARGTVRDDRTRSGGFNQVVDQSDRDSRADRSLAAHGTALGRGCRAG